MAQNTEEKKIVGLLPMGLAETNKDGRNDQKCYPILQKILAIIFLIIFAVGFYILILKLLETDDTIHNTEIIVVSGLQDSQNMSISNNEIEISVQFKNKSASHFNSSSNERRENLTSNERRKREAITSYKNFVHEKSENYIKFKDNEMQKARKLIAEHNVLCNDDSHKEICHELVMKIKSLTENNFSNHRDNKEGGQSDKTAAVNLKHKTEVIATDVSKRETNPTNIHRLLGATRNIDHEIYPYGSEQQNMHSMAYPRDTTNTQLSDNCLFNRLMRQTYSNLHGMFDTPHHHDYQQMVPSYRHLPSDPYLETREIEAHKHNLHPQDIEIAMKFIGQQHGVTSKDVTSNSSTIEVVCAVGTVSCDNGNLCIKEKEWCDGKVDCDDVSDESRCSCKSRVDESRICDGYFDCPFGEDEMGCYGCSEDTFSCEDLNMKSQSTCYSKEQRCNNVADCPNHKDEMDCSILSPSLHKKPLFSISNTEGYLHRNYKGNWYAVCSNPYMWAHDACRRETGLIIRPPYIQVMQIDPLIKVNYISTAPGGLIHTSNMCLNSSAVYVTCPDLLCGTRVPTTTQLLRDNSAMENHLFGRNKRFLQRPYPVRLYDRVKRYTPNKRDRSSENTRPHSMLLSYLEEIRNKRAESRVVGGKPSQPAAWPWVVALYRDGMFHCGGVIINQNWVMSAAHCVNKFWQHYYEIQVGMLRRFSFSPQEQNHRVTHVIVNQNYDQEDMKNDLSLLRVKPGIQFSRWVRPICLPSPEVAGSDWMWGPKADTTCIAVGWGATVEKGPDPDHMREVEVPIWENCKHQEDQAGREICAGVVEGGKDACQGDSGGPLLCRNPINTQQWYVAGIVSHGDGCGRKDEPGVYTRVSLFVQWIRYHTSATKTLPLIQPKQECPGFRCDSGISKCLPKKRMCDKIIDCLDGEDEFNCDFSKSPEESEQTNMIETNSLTREASKSGNNETSVNQIDIIHNGDDNVITIEKAQVIDESNENSNINLKLDMNNEASNSHDMTSDDGITEDDIETAKDYVTPTNYVKPNDSILLNNNIVPNSDVTLNDNKVTNDDAASNDVVNSNSYITVNNNGTPNYDVNSNAPSIDNVTLDNSTSNNNLTTNDNLISNNHDKFVKKINNGVSNYATSSESDINKKRGDVMNIDINENPNQINEKINMSSDSILDNNSTSFSTLQRSDSQEKNISNDSIDNYSSISTPHERVHSFQTTSEPSTVFEKIDIIHDMKYASTIELPIDDISQNIEDEEVLDENATEDPLQSASPNEQLEQYAVDINKSKYPIDSMSSIFENNPDETKNNTENNEVTLTLAESSSSPVTFKVVDGQNEVTTKRQEPNEFFEEKKITPKKSSSNTIEGRDSIDDEAIIKNNENLNKNKLDKKESHELIIELLPNHKLNDELNVRSTENTTRPEDQILFESTLNHKTHFQKPLDAKENKNRIEDIIMHSELQPAKIRKKHRTFMEFQCKRIYQTVSAAARCDHKADCEDGTDEVNCTCLDYLTTFDKNLICDGNFDCADGQDEADCYSCEEDHFLCKRSEICLASKYVCDGNPQCPFGEDELDCFTLSNGIHFEYDINGRPEVSLEGYLTKKHNNKWHIVCEDDMSIHEQEETASRMCRYLGFSAANRFMIKYINLKNDLKHIENHKIKKRNIDQKVPVHFTYKSSVDDQLKAIDNPTIIKEECVPNITKVCMALYISCEHSLFTDFDVYQELRDKKNVSVVSKEWPWIAKLYIDGNYQCTGVLVDLSWVLVSSFCLHGVTLGPQYLSVLLGSHKTLGSTLGPYEQVHQVDLKKDLYSSKVTLLHLRKLATYSAMVKPMVVMRSSLEDKHTKCVTVGQDKHNKTFSVFLKETDVCDSEHRCFIPLKNSTCHPKKHSHWAGIISCHSKQGWYPAASFVEAKGECAFTEKVFATKIGNLKPEIKEIIKKEKDFLDEGAYGNCEGVRCQRGLCIKLRNVCDGVTDCEDGVDESYESCKKKNETCKTDPYYRGCECPVGQLKCHNGRCIAKELFNNGHNDCGDGTDEPVQTMCADYLRRVMPSRLCDGVLHCHDRSDENPMFCKCYAKKAYNCAGMSHHEDYCVAMDMVCDGVPDCPNGEDEKVCTGLNAEQGTPHGIGEVIVRSHGVWYSKCYPTQNHTKSELEGICRELGFISGHAKQLPTLHSSYPHNNVIIDNFSDVTLNNNTMIKLRNSQMPIARAIVDNIKDCYPVFIECL